MFKLIQSALFDVPVSPADLEGVDWKDIYVQANKQTVLGIVSEAIGKLPPEVEIPKECKDMFLSSALANIRAHTLLDHTVAEVVNFYRQHGIEGVVLKGQGVARYYPNPQMRQCGDIDFYIRNGDFEKAKDLAIDHWLGDKEVKVQETYKHFGFDIGKVEIELHRTPTIPKRPWQRAAFKNWFNESLEYDNSLRHIDIGDTIAALPPVEFDALYIFYHAFSHLVENEGVGLRQLCDWAIVLHHFHKTGNREILEKQILNFGLSRLWQIMGYIVVNSIGLPKDEMPLYSERYKHESERLLSQIMIGGNFGKYSPDNKRRGQNGYWKNKFNTYLTFQKNLTKMWYLSPIDILGSYLWFTTTGLKRAIKTAISSPHAH